MMAGAAGRDVVQRITEDPMVHTLLEMYDLVLPSERDQVEQALEPAYAYIESHGGSWTCWMYRTAACVCVSRVVWKLSWFCRHAAAGRRRGPTRGLPGFTMLVAEDPSPPKRTAIQFGPTVLRKPRWVDVGPIEDFPAGEMRALWPEGKGVLVVRLDGEVYAHQNGCPPGSALGLHLGELQGSAVICPWHGCRYDLRTGKRLDAEGKLGVLPVAVQDGMVKIAMGLEEVTAP
jgi:nitrite reductase/ring-hydroxylating ferredoxin subunit